MLRHLVIAVMLLAAPVTQARLALACGMQGGALMTHCCCDEHVDAMPCGGDAEAMQDGRCCTLSAALDSGGALHGSAPGLDKKPGSGLVLGPAPPLAVAPLAAPAPLPPPAVLAAGPANDGRALYLHTARLRL